MRMKLKERYAVSDLTARVQLHSQLMKTSYNGQLMEGFVAVFKELLDRLASMDSSEVRI